MKKLYPITLKLFRDRRKVAYEQVRRVPRHKNECFIGVCEPLGSFLVEEPQAVFDNLMHGEVLGILPDEVKKLTVTRRDGTELGFLRDEAALLISRLISDGSNVFGRLESKELKGDTLAVALSVYCLNY